MRRTLNLFFAWGLYRVKVKSERPCRDRRHPPTYTISECLFFCTHCKVIVGQISDRGKKWMRRLMNLAQSRYVYWPCANPTIQLYKQDMRHTMNNKKKELINIVIKKRVL